MATTATINTGSLPQFTDLVKRSFIGGLEILSRDMRDASFVIEENQAENTGTYKRITERLTRSEYASGRPEGDVAKQTQVQYGYEKDLSITTIALAVSITKVMRKGGKDKEIIDKVTSLTEVVPNTIDADLSHRITFFTATTYVNRDGDTVDITVGDGLALGSAVHTLTGSATTYSTIISGNPQFTKGALELGEKSMVEGTFNNLGQKMAVKPDTILTTDDPNTCNQVAELMKSTANVDSSNSGTFNVYQNKYKHVIAPRIATTANGSVDSTKAKYWALIDSRLSDFTLAILYDAELSTPMDGNNGEDISSGNWNYVVDAMYGIAIATPKAFRLSTGLGS